MCAAASSSVDFLAASSSARFFATLLLPDVSSQLLLRRRGLRQAARVRSVRWRRGSSCLRRCVRAPGRGGEDFVFSSDRKHLRFRARDLTRHINRARVHHQRTVLAANQAAHSPVLHPTRRRRDRRARGDFGLEAVKPAPLQCPRRCSINAVVLLKSAPHPTQAKDLKMSHLRMVKS